VACCGTLSAASEVAAGPRRGMFPPRTVGADRSPDAPSSPNADAGERRWPSCPKHHAKSITLCPPSSG
jgi:hypothetical protein